VRFAPDWQGQELSAIGNVWNANLQGAGPDGRYYITSVSAGTPLAIGENFELSQPAGTTPNRILLH
jgi:hypothetical protein